MKSKHLRIGSLICSLIVLAMMLINAGCNEVQMTPGFAEALDRSAVEAREWNARAQSDDVSCDDIKSYMEQNAAQWTGFQKAKDGS